MDALDAVRKPRQYPKQQRSNGMSTAMNYWKIRFRMQTGSLSEMVITAMNAGAARKLFASIVPRSLAFSACPVHNDSGPALD